MMSRVIPASLIRNQQIKLKVIFCVHGVISPLLTNIYLHYVLDLWVEWWRRHHAHGEVYIVRYSDDFVMGFQYRLDAERFQAGLKERMAQFSLEMHEDKTRLVEFGRFAVKDPSRKS